MKGFDPKVPAESDFMMGRLSNGYGAAFEFHDAMGGYLLEDFDFGPCNLPSPGGYAMHIGGPVPDRIRGALEEAFAAYGRDEGRGLLPEDAAYLFRTPYGLAMVHTEGDRDGGLHRLLWGTGEPAGPAGTAIMYAPDGTLDEPLTVELFCLFASVALASDARDAWSIPGADALELEQARRDLEALGDRARRAGTDLYGRMAGALEAEGVPARLPGGGFDPRWRGLAGRFRDEECAARRRRAAELGKLDPLERDRPCPPGTWQRRSVPFMEAVLTGRLAE